MNQVATLFRAHLTFVWRVLRRARVPAADIDDVAQDVFLVLLRKQSTDEPDHGSPSTPDQERALLYKTAGYEVKNYRRRGRHRHTEPMDDSTDEIANLHNNAARSDDLDQLLVLLDGTAEPGRAVFELVELEGFSVAEAARTLEIPESTARKRLDIAQNDIKAAAAKLAKSDQEAGKKRASTFLLPFGVGAWLQLRDLQNPPAGTADRIWKRLQGTVAEMAREVNLPASTPPLQPPPRARLRGLSRLARPLKSPWSHLVSAGVGAVVMALLFLQRPNSPIAILRLPGPLVLLTSTATATTPTPEVPGSPPASAPAPAPAPAEAKSADDAALAAEMVFLRRARTTYAMGNRRETLAALDDYDARYPAGRFKSDIATLRALLPDAGAR